MPLQRFEMGCLIKLRALFLYPLSELDAND
jgi:hypothetical protein